MVALGIQEVGSSF